MRFPPWWPTPGWGSDYAFRDQMAWLPAMKRSMGTTHWVMSEAAGVDPTVRGPARDEARLRGLVTQHVDFIWRSLRRLGVIDGDVGDAAQQVFLIAAKKLDQIRPGSE